MLSIAETFKKLPSEVLGIDDEYVAYCFNQACIHILNEIKDGKKPIFSEDKIYKKRENTGLQMLLRE